MATKRLRSAALDEHVKENVTENKMKIIKLYGVQLINACNLLKRRKKPLTGKPKNISVRNIGSKMWPPYGVRMLLILMHCNPVQSRLADSPLVSCLYFLILSLIVHVTNAALEPQQPSCQNRAETRKEELPVWLSHMTAQSADNCSDWKKVSRRV